MIYYLIPLMISLISVIRYDINQKGNGLLAWVFLYVYTIVLIGARFEVGGDTLNYMEFWTWQTDLSHWTLNFEEYFAPGYSLLCALSYSISPEFYVFQFIHIIILNTLLFSFLYKNSTYKFATLTTVFILTYLYFSTEILREVIAVLIFAINYNNLKNHRWLYYFFWTCIGILFHYSALILVLFPFITWIKFDKRYVFCCCLVCMFFLSFSSIVGLLENVAIIGQKVAGYSQDTTHGKLADFMELLRGLIFPLGFVLIAKFGMHRSVKYENMIAIMTLFELAAFFSPIIFARFSNYVILFYAIAVGDTLVDYIRGSVVAKRNAIIIVLLFGIIYGSEYLMYRRYMRWIPYYSIWNPHQAERDNYNQI